MLVRDKTRGMLGAICVVVALSGCGNATTTVRPSVTASARPTPSATPTPTATWTPAVPGVTVVTTGAFATNDGTIGVAVLRNPGTTGVTGITVTVTASSQNGQGPVTGTGTLAGLAPGDTEAAVVSLTVPPTDAIGSVSATASASAVGAYTDPLSAGPARFTTANFQPEVIVTASNGSAAAVQGKVVAVCYDSAGKLIGGGVSDPVALAPGESRTEEFLVSALDTPDYCKGYATPVV